MQKILRYRFFVNIIKIASIAIGAIILGIFYIKTYDWSGEDKKLIGNIVNEQKYEISLENPIFEGVTKDQESYQIRADQVIRKNNKDYDLSNVKADYKLDNKNLFLSAIAGGLDENLRFLKLYNSVDVLFERLKLKANFLNIDLVNKSMNSNQIIYLFYKNSKLKADSLLYESDNEILNLKGNVRVKINLSDFKN